MSENSEMAALRAEVERLRGPFRCCEHCKDDIVHDVEPNQHGLDCNICADTLTRRAEAAEAEVRAVREERDALRARVEALADLTEGPNREGTAKWSQRDRDIYSLAIEEARAVLADGGQK